MQKKRVSLAFVLVGALAMARTVAAAEAPEGTRITDPATLASLGFATDATVYLAPGVRLDANTPEAPNYGLTTPIQLNHAGNDFQGRISTYAYDTAIGARDVSYVSGDTFVDVAVNLPSGALWESTRFWVVDAVAADIGLFLFKSCLPVSGPGAPVQTQVGTGTSTGTTGNQSIVVAVTPVQTIDNNGCMYWARARFGAVGHGLMKARTQYRLQVSPAPATATFPNDVPTTHPFFRFVEALAQSGLTGGCGPGAFCPDTPVTRGQLAVLMAAALGLHFPN